MQRYREKEKRREEFEARALVHPPINVTRNKSNSVPREPGEKKWRRGRGIVLFRGLFLRSLFG